MILGLDIATKTGWAVFNDSGDLLHYGLIKIPESVKNKINKLYSNNLDFIYLEYSIFMAYEILQLIHRFNPNCIIIEQTNQSKNRYTQKLLEFIHCNVLLFLRDISGINLYYLSTSEWRKILNLKLSKQDKINNQKVSQGLKRGKITAKHLSVKFVNYLFNLGFKIHHHDIADAICIAYAGFLTYIQNKDIVDKT